MVEADFISAVQDRSKPAFQKWIDPKLNRRYRPQLYSKGQGVEYYITKQIASVPGHTPLVVVNPNGDLLGNIVIKKRPDEVMELHATDLQVVAVPPAHFVPAIIASVLKAAHLTMFNLLGYKHVFSTAGQYLAGILREFFEKYRNTKKNSLSKELATIFGWHRSPRRFTPRFCTILFGVALVRLSAWDDWLAIDGKDPMPQLADPDHTQIHHHLSAL